MNRIAIAFLTKDRVELSRRTIEPLMQPDKFDLHWFDGSVTEEGYNLRSAYPVKYFYSGIRGGADPAILAALTILYNKKDDEGPAYDYIGICENDVLLDKNWFGPTMALFERGKAEGLNVGAVSPRCYQDRILIQRDGYAVVHNLGWGMQIMSREACGLALQHMRITHTTENVLLFSQLSGLDIRRWWAFRGAEQFLCADWGNDKILAAHGFASLALTPSTVEMIGQDPPLAEQGLQIADGRYELLRNKVAFEHYKNALCETYWQTFKPTFHSIHRDQQGYLYFPHQLGQIGATWQGDWRLQWAQGFGPFAWRAGNTRPLNADPGQIPPSYLGAPPQWNIPVCGPCSVIVSGGKSGGKVLVEDEQSGYEVDPELPPEQDRGALQLHVPGSVVYRNIRVTARTPGVIFYGLRASIEQPTVPYMFDWNRLPPV